MTNESLQTHDVEIDNSNRSTTPRDQAFVQFLATGWADREVQPSGPWPVAPFAAQRRDALSAKFSGDRLVIEAGRQQVRSNDTFYLFRPHSAFAHLTGWGQASEPGSKLVFEPRGDSGHTATLYVRESAGRDSDEFYANPEVGEFWIGSKPSLEEISIALAIETRPLADFAPTEADRTLTDEALATAVSELRLVKDSFEIAELQAAVNATADGFEQVLQALPRAQRVPRGERVVETAFATQARIQGNGVGYETIAAAGPHACTLHWMHNDGPVRDGDLLLLDAGIELESLYTADITRTVPVNGSFTPVQRRVYDAVLRAADAAHAIVRPGIRFRDVHAAAMEVIEATIREWGLWPEQEVPDAHRRYMVHGTSHHLGLDVHDCAAAKRELYLDGILEAGMVFTIEPGLYFQPDDLTVPAELRGIGVRIEDDIVVTETASRNLSADIPRTAAEVEAWVNSHLGAA